MDTYEKSCINHTLLSYFINRSLSNLIIIIFFLQSVGVCFPYQISKSLPRSWTELQGIFYKSWRALNILSEINEEHIALLVLKNSLCLHFNLSSSSHSNISCQFIRVVFNIALLKAEAPWGGALGTSPWAPHPHIMGTQLRLTRSGMYEVTPLVPL